MGAHAMIGEAGWRGTWRLVAPVDSVPVELHRSASKRRALTADVKALPPGTYVVLLASAPGAAGRCTAFARAAGLEPLRGYLAFPSAQAPAYLVEDAPDTIRVFVRLVLATPPRITAAALLEAGLTALRVLCPLPVIRMLAPGRVVVGRRV